MQDTPAHPGNRFLPAAVPVAVALITFAAFWPVLQNGFVNWDDAENFITNTNYRGFDWARLAWMFTTVRKGIYMPLTWITCALDFRLWGMSARGYHLTNLLWHCANAVLLYAVSFALFRRRRAGLPAAGVGAAALSAGFAALVFSVHPLRVESVAWITERRDVLSGFFALLCVGCYLRAAETDGEESSYHSWIVAALASFAASLLSKPAGVPLPLVLLILDVYPLGRLPGAPQDWGKPESLRVWREKGAFCALASPFGLLAIWSQAHSGAMTKLLPQTVLQRLAVAAYGVTFYVWKTLIPAGLSPLYRMPDAVGWGRPAFLICGLLVVAAAAIVIAGRRRRPALAAAGLSYLVLLFPVSGIFHAGIHLTADRYSYLSCMPWAILAGAAFLRLWTAGTEDRLNRAAFITLVGICILAIAGWAGLSRRQSRVWRDSETLWRRVLALDPNCAMAYTNLGNIAMDRGQSAQATEYFQHALEIQPDFPYAHNNLGILDLVRGRVPEAEAHFRAAIAANPGLSESYSNLGAVFYYQGNLQGAFNSFQKALTLKADYTDAYYNLGKLMLSRGMAGDAIAYFQKTLSIDPGYAAVYGSMGEAYASLGRVDEAIAQFQKALSINPRLADARNKLQNLLSARLAGETSRP